MQNHIFKKLIIFTALMGPIVAITPANAAMMADDGQELWTIEELIAFHDEDELDRTEQCAYVPSVSCDYLLYHDRLNAEMGEGHYYAADLFNTQRFLITSINPSNNTVRIIFHDYSWMKRWYSILHEEDSLTEFYLIWSEADINSTGDALFLYPFNETKEILGDKMHVVYALDSLEEYESLPKNEEIEIFVPDLELSENNTGYLYSLMIGDRTFWTEVHDYSACLNSEKYQLGMNCRLLINGMPDYVYMPLSDAELLSYPSLQLIYSKPEDNHEESEEAIIGEDPLLDNIEPEGIISKEEPDSNDEELEIAEANVLSDGENDDTPSTIDNDSTGIMGDDITEVINKDNKDEDQPAALDNNPYSSGGGGTTNDSPDNQIGNIKAPETGKKRDNCFPWWFIPLFAAGYFIIAWIFF